nr:hypothetical protein [Brevundimonas naejangsanensis]
MSRREGGALASSHLRRARPVLRPSSTVTRGLTSGLTWGLICSRVGEGLEQ